MSALRSTDLIRLLDLVHAMNEAPDGAFLRTALVGTAGLVASDTVSYNEQDTSRATEERFVIEPEYTERIRIDAAYLENLGQHPAFEVVSRGLLAPGDSVAVSDLIGTREYHRLPIYREYYRHREVEDQLVVLLGARHTRTRLLVLSRSRVGFGARDRAAVRLFVPHLRQAIRYRQRLARAQAAAGLAQPSSTVDVALDALTPRERDIVSCLASGATDGQIGRVLGISGRTVGKHLENVYRKLGVSNRSALVGLTRGSPPISR